MARGSGNLREYFESMDYEYLSRLHKLHDHVFKAPSGEFTRVEVLGNDLLINYRDLRHVFTGRSNCLNVLRSADTAYKSVSEKIAKRELDSQVEQEQRRQAGCPVNLDSVQGFTSR
jgi:hypothetical protein